MTKTGAISTLLGGSNRVPGERFPVNGIILGRMGIWSPVGKKYLGNGIFSIRPA